MKNTIKNIMLIISAFTVLSLSSCSDYLNTEPTTETTVESTGKVIATAAEAESRMTSVYASFGGEYWQLDYFFNGDAQTDNAYAGSDNTQNFQQDEYRILSTNTNVSRDWGYIYDNINKCNFILNYIDEPKDLPAARKEEMIGEASLVRALNLFHAVQLWGDVPIATKAVVNVNQDNFEEVYPQLYPTRKPRQEVYAAEGWGSPVGAWGTSMFYGTDWKKFMTPSNDLIQTFTNEGDVVRKKSSVIVKEVSWTDNYWTSAGYPFAYKMRITDGKQNFYILRLADIILLKAEALTQTGDNAGAMTLVNQVRARVGLPKVSAASQGDALDLILKERKMELAFEGHRWFDLKRTAKAIEILSKQKDGKGAILPYAGNLNQDRLLWPIPQTKKDANPNLIQNPGY
ncbi:MAG: RagB/SusD family nutrient uptake outer membrane protein [Flavobacterium circumlabens]|uniref:RagB/SusD family nutrient uptake outer membrane protein n=1 Tax=Flavobacterium circumlabens TaxID=2133765 RepID=UPI00326529D5